MRISDWSSDVCSSDLFNAERSRPLRNMGRIDMVEEKPMRVVLAEPQTLVRAGLRHLLEIHASEQIVAEAADGATLLDMVGRLRPGGAVPVLTPHPISRLASLLHIRLQ